MLSQLEHLPEYWDHLKIIALFTALYLTHPALTEYSIETFDLSAGPNQCEVAVPLSHSPLRQT